MREGKSEKEGEKGRWGGLEGRLEGGRGEGASKIVRAITAQNNRMWYSQVILIGGS